MLERRATRRDDCGARKAQAANTEATWQAAVIKPEKIVIIGGGAAGFAAVEMLRRSGYQNSIVMLSSDDALPYDRPNLSKDYLAGTIPFDYVPLRMKSFYADNSIETRMGQAAVQVDIRAAKSSSPVVSKIPYDRLLLATGAEPVRLTIPGADQPHVRTLRSLADCQAIIERAKAARRVVVIGASFIGLEVAAALRTRNLEVHVVAPDKRPMERILGPDMGNFIRALHEEHGVVFHLEDKVAAIDKKNRPLGERWHDRGRSGGCRHRRSTTSGACREGRPEARPRGRRRQYLETSAPGVYAAGDIARWPDPHSGENIRVEHWVVAERQGQAAALNMLGHAIPFTAVPFFWSQHYDVPINYVGHAEAWDEIVTEGDIMSKDCVLRFKRNGRVSAVASIFRDLESLEAEVLMERATAE